MASVIMAPTFCSISVRRSGKDWSERSSTNGQHRGMKLKATRIEKPLEELYRVRVEREVSQERLAELGVSRWSMWKTGKCKLPWEGEVRVVPEGSQQYMQFVAGDLVRYPKWLEADLWFNGPYQERYSFRAFGDD